MNLDDGRVPDVLDRLLEQLEPEVRGHTEAVVRVLQPAMAAMWRIGAEYGVEHGAKASFHHAYNYVCQFGPSDSLVNLALIEREIIDRAMMKLPKPGEITCTVSLELAEAEAE